MTRTSILILGISALAVAGCQGEAEETEAASVEEGAATTAAAPTGAAAPASAPVEAQVEEAAAPGPTAATCDISWPGITGWDGYGGPCNFTIGRAGSFTVAPIGRDAFSDNGGYVSISLTVGDTPGRGRLQAADPSGVGRGVADWGDAVRDAEEPACWATTDYYDNGTDPKFGEADIGGYRVCVTAD